MKKDAKVVVTLSEYDASAFEVKCECHYGENKDLNLMVNHLAAKLAPYAQQVLTKSSKSKKGLTHAIH